MEKKFVNSHTLFLLKDLFSCISKKRKLQILLLLFLMAISSAMELLSISSIIPFLSLISSSSSTDKFSSPLTSYFFGFAGGNNIIFYAILFLSFLVASGLIRLINLKFNYKLSALIGSDLSNDAYKRVIYQNYEYHLQNNSSNTVATLAYQIGKSVSTINSFFQLCTAFLVSLAIIVSLLLTDLYLSAFAILLFTFIYIALAIFSKRRLRKNSELINVYTKKIFLALNESLSSIKDIILSGNQAHFIYEYSNADYNQRILVSENSFVSASPRYILETLGISFIALTGLFLKLSDNSVDIIPKLGVFALASQKLLPSLQVIYSSWSQINSSHAEVKSVLSILSLNPFYADQESIMSVLPASFTFNELRFRNVYFSYFNTKTTILRNINITIKKGQVIGIVGKTGSGKSTFVDILMGLLTPSSGYLEIDGVPLTSESIQKNLHPLISHVPQSVFLYDLSLGENIAFCSRKYQPASDKNIAISAERAQISEYINSLPDKYGASAGERGTNLSGGQIQRIGIARALYKYHKILILDEATSALDTATETKVINSILETDPNITIIMIAHRLSTLKRCTRILEFDRGSIIHDITPEEFFSTKL